MVKGVKHPSPFKIKLDFGEALERFIHTKPSEVEALTKRGKKAKPSGKPKRKPAQPELVVDLRQRRMRKRNEGR